MVLAFVVVLHLFMLMLVCCSRPLVAQNTLLQDTSYGRKFDKQWFLQMGYAKAMLYFFPSSLCILRPEQFHTVMLLDL